MISTQSLPAIVTELAEIGYDHRRVIGAKDVCSSVAELIRFVAASVDCSRS